MKKLYVLTFVFILFLLFDSNAFAAENSAGSSAALLSPLPKANDIRTQTLKEFLEKYNSPLKEHAEVFVETADKYNLDWRLVAAISGVESTFGQQIPNGSFNGWGWGIYGNNVIRFSSWDEGIRTVSQGLRENYINRGAENVYQIGRIYAASPTWAYRVEYFMNDIDKFALDSLKSLPISL